MKVYICSTCFWRDDEVEDLLKRYPVLNEFHFVVEEVKRKAKRWILDENRERILQEYEVIGKETYITLETLDDLVRLRKAVEVPLIFDETGVGDGYCIELYDGYRE